MSKHTLRLLVNRTKRASAQSQRLAEQPLRLHLLAASRERDCQVARREQRLLVLCTEQACRGDEDLALDLSGFGVLVLLFERVRQ